MPISWTRGYPRIAVTERKRMDDVLKPFSRPGLRAIVERRYHRFCKSGTISRLRVSAGGLRYPLGFHAAS